MAGRYDSNPFAEEEVNPFAGADWTRRQRSHRHPVFPFLALLVDQWKHPFFLAGKISLDQDPTANSSNRIDRISALLLCQILSFLPMKEAAATSILSPRWRYLLTSIPVINLVFNDTSDELDPIQRENSHLKFSRFIDFCINLIRQRNTAPIRKFGLTIFPPWLCERFQLQMDSLISALPLCNVQELEIFLFENDAERSNLLGIFTCKTLVVLKMDRQVDLDIPNSVALPDLKVLCLEC
ncbi:putative FBD-associated F-box protein At5g56410 [Coffea eugenioides]|uniref:putative FBD-associated F-box protein At5g56410 n=1 Tax=Coffea eugenioides TaxID=49369 RepID=UPI000F612166|nr:putative FBD-associated F-box protein At5g56410 [Coffea eugenioides]